MASILAGPTTGTSWIVIWPSKAEHLIKQIFRFFRQAEDGPSRA
jgi:hypothetical protein